MEVVVRRHIVNEVPSLSSLSRYDDYRNIGVDNSRLISNLNSMFGDNSYFGSEYDRYSSSFTKTINYFNTRSMIAERDLKISLGAISEINAFRTCNTEESLRNLPPCMVEPITFSTRICDLYSQNRIQGWADYTAEEIKENKKKWHRLLNQNGINRYDPRTSSKDKESTFRIVTKSGDPELTFEERDDIEATREYVEWIMENTDIDPTDMDEIVN